MSRRFVLLDRDGTINEEADHLSDPDRLELLPRSLEGLRELRALDLGLVVVTNQADIGRGLLSEERLAEIHARLRAMLAAGGVDLDAFYHCPHSPEDGCECRKPKPGMALAAAADHGFDPARAFVVGDHAADMGLGRAIAATTVFVLTGHGPEEAASGATAQADHVASDLLEAAGIIRGIVKAEVG
jgi:D-glycero-D-manno-heptose 1,7-bisphosphate phosphatase